MKESLLEHENKYRAIQGILFKNSDVAKWESAEFNKFFMFLEELYDPSVGRMKITNEKVKDLTNRMRDDAFPYMEYMYRINKFYIDAQKSLYLHKEFYYRIATMMRVVIGYVKKHPQVISEEVIERIKDKPQFAWCLNTYRTKTTDIGAEIVETDGTAYEGNRKVMGARTADAERLMLESMVRVTDVYNMIVKSITKKEIESLPVKDRINSLQKLSFIYSATRNFKPNAQVFQQINVFKAGREELESALLDFKGE